MMHIDSCKTLCDRRATGTLRGRQRWLWLAIALGAGCGAEEPSGFEIEHYAGDEAAEAPALHTGTIATPSGLREVSYEVIDGHAVVEGDIVIPWSDFVDPDVAHAGTITRSWTWPGGVVPYVIDPALSDQGRVHSAIAHWHQNTGIRLVPRTNQADYVRFTVGIGCGSNVGRIGGQQNIELHAACSTGNTIHEIGHAIGLWHEQSRQDRDSHVIIHTSNIEPYKEHNFNKYSVGMDVGVYDFGSIMHYGSYAFTRNGQPTITKRDGGLIEGQRNGLSPGDRLGAGVLYSALATGNDMQAWEMLAPGQHILSSDGRFSFVYQYDGNLVAYRTLNGAPIWASGTWGSSPGALFMQHDGNLVIYNSSGVPIWASQTHGQAGSRLVIQNDGNIVIYTAGGTPIWATNTMQ
jgi:hypothetical protein